jgi:hypothetical protein
VTGASLAGASPAPARAMEGVESKLADMAPLPGNESTNEALNRVGGRAGRGPGGGPAGDGRLLTDLPAPLSRRQFSRLVEFKQWSAAKELCEQLLKREPRNKLLHEYRKMLARAEVELSQDESSEDDDSSDPEGDDEDGDEVGEEEHDDAQEDRDESEESEAETKSGAESKVASARR